MKYIYAVKYKEKTRYKVVVCTQGRRKIHLGYADSIEKAKEIRNKFFGITNDLIKRRLNLIIFAISSTLALIISLFSLFISNPCFNYTIFFIKINTQVYQTYYQLCRYLSNFVKTSDILITLRRTYLCG